nr:hypothetical protein [Tanacetum cinerariifolium]
MAFESSTPTTNHTTPASNVAFECGKGAVAFNNSSALLKHKNPWEFWYSTEEDTSINTITFTLSCSSKPMYFDLYDFSTITRLKYSENYDALPLKETIRAALETLGLAEEKNPQFTPSDLINKSLLRIRYFLPIWRVLMLHSQMLRRYAGIS